MVRCSYAVFHCTGVPPSAAHLVSVALYELVAV